MRTAAIIGSGPSGLTAAITLARAGVEVTVFERDEQIGGSAKTAELTLPGFRHDVCSAIHPMAVDSAAWRSLDLAAHGLKWVRSPAALAHPLQDHCALVWQNLDDTATGLGADGAAWRKMCAPFLADWRAFAGDAIAPLTVPSHPLLMARFGLKAIQSAERFARDTFKGRAARALFAGMAAHSVLPLDAPFSTAIGLMLTLAAHAEGWPFAQGGAQAISDALAAELRAHGGSIVTGKHIDTLTHLQQDAVFFCTSPRAMADIAGDALPDAYAKRLRDYRHGPGIFKCDFAVSEPIPWRHADTALAACVHLGGDLQSIALSEKAPWHGEHAARPFVLLAQPSLFDSSRAPEGRHTVWAYCHVPAGSTRDMRPIIEAEIERHAPGFRETILACHSETAADVQGRNPNYVGGDVNGGANTWDQLLTRPVATISPYSTPNRRLWLCSAATPPGGGVHGLPGWYAARSALAAA